jgi:hypothetical protein
MNAGQHPLSCHVVHDTGTVGFGDTDLKKLPSQSMRAVFRRRR